MNVSRIFLLIAVCITALGFTACDEDDDSYAELRKTERRLVSNFITGGLTLQNSEGVTLLSVAPIKVISQEEFEKDTVTDVAENEYVLFANTGLYMQIIRRGTGTVLAEGESAPVICRYVEYNMAGDSIQSTNRTLLTTTSPDVMNVSNSYGTLTGTFQSGVMRNTYGSSVPSAWLTPLQYIKLGRQTDPENQVALVRIIAPSSVGHTNQSSLVYPCFYEISYQRGR
ncbi:MAG: DUF4827 domain-containing protein [Bacteroidaceae bacterium]|nr:DUF4827 domain-containing protein [Bacteroidaceae bacterium]